MAAHLLTHCLKLEHVHEGNGVHGSRRTWALLDTHDWIGHDRQIGQEMSLLASLHMLVVFMVLR